MVCLTQNPSHRAVPVIEMGMGRLAILLISFLLLLISLHGVQADYDDYNYEDEFFDFPDDLDYDESEYDYEQLAREDDADVNDTEEAVVGYQGPPPQHAPQPQLVSSECRNEACQIKVGWPPSEGDTCLRGYRVGFKQIELGVRYEWTWIDKLGGTHKDLTTNKQFFLEEAEGALHVLAIPNLEHQTTYQVVIEVFNPFGSKMGNALELTTPPGSTIHVAIIH